MYYDILGMIRCVPMTWPVGKNGGVGIEVGDGGCGGVCGAGRNAVVVGVGAE